MTQQRAATTPPHAQRFRRRFDCLILAVCCCGFIALAARAQTPPASPPAQQPVEKPVQEQDLHFGIKLGLRSLQVAQAFPLIDRVVLVPDAATYLDEISKWSPRGRWPVLFDEQQFAPMFMRRFKPAEVVRRSSVGKLPVEAERLQTMMRHAVIRAWGADPDALTLAQTFASHKFKPPGVVVTSTEDPAWTAAVALAAGHGQPLCFIDGKFGEDRAAANDNVVARFRRELDAFVTALPYSSTSLGDDIDAVTVCRSLAPRTRSAPERKGDAEGYAFTDLIGRHENGSRWAFAGWIFGDERRCAYVAMCSLFLDRSDTLLINTYPEEGEWGAYSLANVNEALRQIGFTPTHFGEAWATIDNWLRMLPAGVTTDFIMMNTRGMRESFELASGRAFAIDVPILNTPAAVHFIHSFSMNNPEERTTVAGRWIDHGAYAYVGSVVEPTLAGFVPPILITERIVNYVPFLVAARHWDAPYSNPGKIATYGDPLMLIIPPEKAKKERVAPPPMDDGVNLRDRVRDLMLKIKDAPDGELYRDAIDDLVMLGKDDVAAELWVHARQSGFAEAAADRALGPLFRLNRRGEFMRAWAVGGMRTPTNIDMLWHLWPEPALGSADKDTLLFLQSVIRAGQPEVDVGRLLPHLEASFGIEHVVRLVEREITKATDDGTRKRLGELIGRQSKENRPRRRR